MCLRELAKRIVSVLDSYRQYFAKQQSVKQLLVDQGLWARDWARVSMRGVGRVWARDVSVDGTLQEKDGRHMR